MINQPLGIALICDQQRQIVEVIRDEFGIGVDQSLGKPFHMVVDEPSANKAVEFLTAVDSTGAAFGWEMNLAVDGQLVTLHFAGGKIEGRFLVVAAKTTNGVMQLYEELMRIGNEQMNALRAALKDQSELMRAQAERDSEFYDKLSQLNNELANLQRELAKKNTELEHLNALKNQFLGMAAHDLRNPLGVIMGFSEFLLQEAKDTLEEEHVEFLSIIHDSSKFMLNMVNDLLDIAHIESGKLQLQRIPTDLVALTEHSVLLNRILAAKKDINIHFQSGPDIPYILLDAAKIDQVLNNLLTNAIKYSHPRTTITVRIVQQDTGVILSVCDEGQGIPTQELEKLFQPFKTTSVQSTAGESSTGLGLVIVRRIVHGHGGDIWVESSVGVGTTFYVSLPYNPQP